MPTTVAESVPEGRRGRHVRSCPSGIFGVGCVLLAKMATYSQSRDVTRGVLSKHTAALWCDVSSGAEEPFMHQVASHTEKASKLSRITAGIGRIVNYSESRRRGVAPRGFLPKTAAALVVLGLLAGASAKGSVFNSDGVIPASAGVELPPATLDCNTLDKIASGFNVVQGVIMTDASAVAGVAGRSTTRYEYVDYTQNDHGAEGVVVCYPNGEQPNSYGKVLEHAGGNDTTVSVTVTLTGDLETDRRILLEQTA